MAVDESASFGAQLRRHRLRAGLTQQALAERGGLSLRGLSDLERGARRAPYPDTVRRLAEAIGLSEADRTALVASSSRVGFRASDLPTIQLVETVPPMPVSSFVGRQPEVAEVLRLVGANRLVSLTGPGDIGKTRLALEAARQMTADFTDGVAWSALNRTANVMRSSMVGEPTDSNQGTARWPGRLQTNELGQNAQVLGF